MPFDFNGEESENSRSNNISKTGSSHGFQNIESMSARGFKNIPERKNTKSNSEFFQTLSATKRTRTAYSGRTRFVQQKRPIPRWEIEIPWRIMMMIAGILMLIAVLWVSRDAISAFLAQVLSWVITIIIIIFLVKFFIFKR